MADFAPLSTIKRFVSPQNSASGPALLGRFELRKILGKGAQSVVWLAFDPRLEREVAIKLMNVGQGANATAIAQWLQEARSVSRLNHPNIVPVFEADVQDQQPYLVFEYVAGQTLAALIAQRGALPPAEAVGLMIDVLEALDAAHGGGVVHRDLKPSNVLVNPSGRARVMDFGIAARIKDPSTVASEPLSGTPGYLAPEAAQGLPATAQVDIFSAGIVLAEMLSGKPLIAESDPLRAIYRVSHEQLSLPKNLSAEVDDRLRAIVLRALALEPAQRHTSARVFKDELVKWAGTAQEGSLAGAAQANNSGSSTLDFLLRRMRHKTDFPAMSDAVVRIQGMATSETESINSVTNEILKDVALTNKLLRLVNSVHYSRGGSISTVSRAVSLVGFNGIRNMALSLVLLEHMQDKAQAAVLKEEFLRSLMAASIASELCLTERDTEEAFIGAMFHNLGRLLAQFYFSEEAQTIRTLVASTRQPVSEATASAAVLGISFEELAIGVAKVWGLPDSIQRCMRKPLGDPPGRVPADAQERLRWTALAANEMADVMLRTDPKAVDGQLAHVAKNYAKTLGLHAGDVQSATNVARKKLIDMADAMDIVVKPGSAAAKLLKTPEETASAHTQHDTLAPPDTLTPLELHATQTTLLPGQEVAQELPGAPAKHVAQILAAGIQDITNAMVEDVKLSDLLRMILETMLRAMDFQRIIFCLRDPKTDALTGRFGLGSDVDSMVKVFRVPLQLGTPDLFTAVCTKGADAMISDATESHITKRLPEWYRKQINAPTFLLLPVNIKGRPLGLIYADMAEKGELVLDEKELALLQTLRNQAVMAFRQSS
jgi:serine/threonine protein kinase